MPMKRDELLSKLTTVAPALAVTDIVPIFSHVWFTGTKLMAYNDKIAISLPMKTDIKGAVPGTLLINLLKSSRAESVDLTSKDLKVLRVQAASMDAKLAMHSAEAFQKVFTMPSSKGGERVDEAFLAALTSCMRSVTTDTSVSDQLGVTLLPDRANLELFATNRLTLSYAYLKASPVKVGTQSGNAHRSVERAILPALFCEQVIALSKGKDKEEGEKPKPKEVELEIHMDKSYALATIGDITIFGRLIESEKPLDFRRILDQHMPKGTEEKFVPIPEKLEGILDRAVILTESERLPTEITVSEKGTALNFYCRSALHGHELKDSTAVDKHPAASMKIDAKLLRAGVADFEEMLVTERCAILATGDTYYLVGSRK